MESLAYCYAIAAQEWPSPAWGKPSIRSTAGLAGSLMLASTVMPLAPAEASVARGATCNAVYEIQNALIAAGHDAGTPDSVFGPATEYAVVRFQQRQGLTADGIVGPATAAALGLDANLGCSGTARAVTSSGSGTAASTTTVQVATEGGGLNVRSSPSTTAGIVNVLENGTVVSVQGAAQTGWFQLVDGGWISADWVTQGTTAGASAVPTATPTARSAQIATNGSALNVRQGPGTDYAVVSSVTNGTRVAVSDRVENNWVQLQNGGWVALDWVSSDFED